MPVQIKSDLALPWYSEKKKEEPVVRTLKSGTSQQGFSMHLQRLWHTYESKYMHALFIHQEVALHRLITQHTRSFRWVICSDHSGEGKVQELDLDQLELALEMHPLGCLSIFSSMHASKIPHPSLCVIKQRCIGNNQQANWS